MMEVWGLSFHCGTTALSGFIMWLNQSYGARNLRGARVDRMQVI